MRWRLEINQILSIGLLLLAFGCGNPEAKSKELYDTAQFEEQQRNFKHARQLYERILKEYPNTETAQKADAPDKDTRLTTVGPFPTLPAPYFPKN